ncbi:IS30 family transposase [Roseburia hominis]
MSKHIPGNHKHLTTADRLYIERQLNAGASFKEIACYLCKDPSTISKEVRSHRLSDFYPGKGLFLNAKNFCVHRFHCQKKNVCRKIILCDTKCSSCPSCNQHCKDFVKERCNRLDRAPYVCNGCDKTHVRCTVPHKYHYDALFADRKYREMLRDSRSGINLSKKELHHIDEVVTPLIWQGHSPYQIVVEHPELGLSVRSIYQYIELGLLTGRNIDLKRKVKFKARKCHKTQITDRQVFSGRLYSDFLQLPPTHVVEMDTVKSSRDSKKCILTFYFRDEKLFLAYLLNRCTKGAVRAVFDRLEARLGTETFRILFETVLTDRGGEFGDPLALETGMDGSQRTNIYYCDPMRSGQKGGVENVHTKLREILPKGTSFEYLTQWDLNLIVNNIDSVPRQSLLGLTPYQAVKENFGMDILAALQLKPVNPEKIVLTPELIK